MNRTLNVVRMHLVNRWSFLVLPWVILGSAFVISWLIWLIIASAAGADALEGTQYSGAVMSIYVYMLVVAIAAINLAFPFALGFSATRREFYVGTSLLFVIITAANSLVLVVLSYIEEWTNGWGLGGHMFTVVWVGAGNVAERFLVFWAVQVFLMFVGAAIATVYMRWRINGMVVLWVALGLVLVGIVALLTYTDSWPQVWQWLFSAGTVVISAWLLVPAALAGLAGWAVLRRATPKN